MWRAFFVGSTRMRHALVWMFTAIVLISGFTATIASTLTVRALGSDIQNIQDLRVEPSLGTVHASAA